jgi:hypothetical protein
MRRHISFVTGAAALVLACTGGGGGTTTPGTSTSTSVGITGTLNKKPFTAQSGFAHVDGVGQLTLEFSNAPDRCGDAKAAKFHSNAQFIGFYRLATPADGGLPDDQKAAVGPVISDDMKYAELGTCTSGAPVGEKDTVATGRAEKSTVTLTTLASDKVEGTLDVTFDDGSHISGTFSVPTCSGETPETSYCL